MPLSRSSSARPRLGLLPSESTTRSAASSLASPVSLPSRLTPRGLTATSFWPSSKVTPCFLSRPITSATLVALAPGATVSTMSTTVVLAAPWSATYSAVSRPVRPAPTTTTLLPATLTWSFRTSGTVATPSPPIPGRSGTMGRPPVAQMTASGESAITESAVARSPRWMSTPSSGSTAP